MLAMKMVDYKRVEAKLLFMGPNRLYIQRRHCREWQLATIQCDFNLPERLI